MANIYGMQAVAQNAVRSNSAALAKAQAALQQSGSAIASLNGSAASSARLAQARKVATEFEAVFLSEMLEHSFQGISSNPLTGGGFADDTYRSMQLQEYGKVIANAGGIGIADHVVRALVERQEV